jgi:hypothetical protein
MNFRSPPPHRHSSGHKGGRSEFEKIQRDIARTVKRLGYDKMPLNDETLRPFLAALWEFAHANGTKLYTADTPAHPGKLFQCLISDDPFVLKALANKLQEELLAKFPRAEVDRAKPVFVVGKTSVLYFEAVYTPLEALDGRKH